MTRRGCDTERLWHREVVTQRSCDIEGLWHREAVTQRSCDTEKLWQRSCDIEGLWHRATVTQRGWVTQGGCDTKRLWQRGCDTEASAQGGRDTKNLLSSRFLLQQEEHRCTYRKRSLRNNSIFTQQTLRWTSPVWTVLADFLISKGSAQDIGEHGFKAQSLQALIQVVN